MASSSLAKPGGTLKSNKRLGELLQEQQEPFQLDVYLFERGYPSTRRKGSRGHRYSTPATTGCCPYNISDSNLKRFHSCGYGLKLNTLISIPRQIHPSVPTPQRNINKILPVSICKRRTIKSHHLMVCHDDGRVGVAPPAPPELELELEQTTRCPEAVELDRFSSASSSITVLDSCSDRDRQRLLVSPTVSVPSSSSQQDHIPSSSAHNSQASKFWNLNKQQECIATLKENRPAATDRGCRLLSLLEEVSVQPASSFHIHTSTPIANQPNNKRVTEDSILSASLWELLLQRSLAQKRGSGGVEAVLKELMGSGGICSSYSQYVKTKRVLQQTRQLLFDCVREAIEKHRWSGTGRTRRWHGGLDQFIGPEEIGKIICDEIRVWGKQSIDIANLNQLIEADVSETIEEEGWSGSLKLHAIKNEIGMGIADAVLDEMTFEIVSDMIHIHVSPFDLIPLKKK